MALIVVLAPFSLGIILLEVIGPSNDQITNFLLYYQGLDNPDVMAGKITYAAITNLHFVVCVIIGIRYFFVPKKTPEEKQFIRGSMITTPFILLPLLGFIIIGDLTYSKFANNILESIYGIGDVSCNFSPNYPPVYSRLEFEIASTLPVITAVLATAILVTYTNLQVYLFAKAEERNHENQLFISYNAIVQCLPMYSCLLVTAVISSAVWFHLPVKIFGNIANDDVLKNLQNYGEEMTLFLGVIYTLTALVAITWPIWQLYRKAQNVSCSLALGISGLWLNQEAVIGSKKILAVLAPLVTGLLYNWLVEIA